MALTSKQKEMAALLAASGAAVSKQVFLRDAPPGLQPSRVRPTGISELTRLFSRPEETAAQRVSRLSSAALLYSIDKSNEEQAGRLLRTDEKPVLTDLHKARRKHLKTDRSCPHCRLFTDTLYVDETKRRRIPPIHVVNHRARVDVNFDPETYMSEATLNHFQVIVPQALARKLIDTAHPLNWAKHEGSLFEEIVAVDAEGKRVQEQRGISLQDTWERRLTSGQRVGFIYENFVLPVNETIKSSAENIIRITDFTKGQNGFSLSYGYCLERCLRTNFGLAWEPSGLDVDGGSFAAEAVPLSEVTGVAGDQGSLAVQRRDVLDMQARLARVQSAVDAPPYESDSDKRLYSGWYARQDAEPGDDVPVLPDRMNAENDKKEVARTVGRLHLALEEEWDELAPFYLLTISARKELHFTLPENGPIELWYMMTWMAPATLFMFLNRLCQAPHFLLPGIIADQTKPSRTRAYA